MFVVCTISAGKWSTNVPTDDIKELLAVEKVDKVILVGHDWGALVAWRFANYYSDFLQYLIVLCTPYWVPAEQPFAGWDTLVKHKPSFGYMV